MKLRSLRERLRGALGALICLGALAPLAAAGSSLPEPMPASLEHVIGRLERKLDEAERARLAELLSGWEGLLAYLPVDDLRGLTFGDGWLELSFDFGKKKERVIEIPASVKHFWDAKRKAAVAAKSEAEEIRLRSRIRILFDEQGIRGLREGDLSAKRYLCWWELEARIDRKSRVERDSRGRARVCVDSTGKALMRDEKPVLMECSRWLVLEAKGERVEVALDCPGS